VNVCALPTLQRARPIFKLPMYDASPAVGR
jgi:hypothetical protein